MAVFTHKPVLLKETIAALKPREGTVFIDGTLGRAGHTAALLKNGAQVIGIDRDEQALTEVATTYTNNPDFVRLTAVKGTHGNLAQIAHDKGVTEVDGILLDLGVSSPQLDDATRGFSFLHEGPLDMRMDRAQEKSALSLLSSATEEELSTIFWTLGEEPKARYIAQTLVKARAKGEQFKTTTALADFVANLIGRKGAHHPATRIFQALRMAVNDECGELIRALEGGLNILKEGGIFAVITFESITDRITKRFFAAHAGRMASLQGGGAEWRGELPRVKILTKKPLIASPEEVAENTRARSAKLRVAEKTNKENSYED